MNKKIKKNYESVFPIYVFDESSGFCGRICEIYWFSIMFIGYPCYLIIEWIAWEIKGKRSFGKRHLN